MNAVCRHFGACGGCSLQHLAPDAYLESKRQLIAEALTRHGIEHPPAFEILSVPPRSRRRCTLKLCSANGSLCIGFHAPRSHQVIDIHECHVLTPGLFRLAQSLRDLLGPALRPGQGANLGLLEADNGFDVSIQGQGLNYAETASTLVAAAAKLGIVRVFLNGELLCRDGAPEVFFGGARVELPSGAFLQPTRDGEALLQDRVADIVGKSKAVTDLFSGCGTFALPLAERARVHAVDSEKPMLKALLAAARSAPGLKPVTTEARDLHKLPLTPAELRCFDAVVLDPPRAGTFGQVQQLARSTVRRIAYVSCDAASFARDARVLNDGGFRMASLVGVDQFLWSAHIELVASFTR